MTVNEMKIKLANDVTLTVSEDIGDFDLFRIMTFFREKGERKFLAINISRKKLEELSTGILSILEKAK